MLPFPPLEHPIPQLPEGIWIAIISAAAAIASILIKDGLDRNARRIDEAQADIQAMKEVMGEVVTWAFALETHITEGKPPPPPVRPLALIEFFTTAFVERSRAIEASPLRRGFPFLRKRARRPQPQPRPVDLLDGAPTPLDKESA